MSIPCYVLSDGNRIPAIGLGTWQATNGEVYRAVRHALRVGYRHLDCAYVYENQREIGNAIRDSIREGVLTREELFVTSKIWLTYYRRDRMARCVAQILSDLQLDYVDLLLLHYPLSLAQQDEELRPKAKDGSAIGGEIDFMQAYESLQEVADRGLARSIGVSNFNLPQLRRLLASDHVRRRPPVTNQIESHPYLIQWELQQFCRQNSILVTAYSPLGSPGSKSKSNARNQCAGQRCQLLEDPVVKRLAAKYHKNAGQILIKFQLARGNAVIPKSIQPNRIESNIAIFDFDFTAEEIAELCASDRNLRTCRFAFASALPEYPFRDV